MKYVLLGMILVLVSCTESRSVIEPRIRSAASTAAESTGEPPVRTAENSRQDTVMSSTRQEDAVVHIDADQNLPDSVLQPPALTGPDQPVRYSPGLVDQKVLVDNETEITVTEEVYRATLSEIEVLLQGLSSAIRAGNYRLWMTYLSEEYKHKYDNPSVLADLSESPTLKDKNLRLRSLGDYFRYVVMPSRKGSVRIDRIVFTQPDRLKVVMFMEELPVILYTMRKENDIWKVTVE